MTKSTADKLWTKVGIPVIRVSAIFVSLLFVALAATWDFPEARLVVIHIGMAGSATLILPLTVLAPIFFYCYNRRPKGRK